MTKEELIKINDKFKEKCDKYRLSWNKFKLIDDVIILNDDNVYVLLDENFNTMGIVKKEFKSKEELENYFYEYNLEYNDPTYDGNPPFGNMLFFPFVNYKLKDISDIANKVSVYKEDDNIVTKFEDIDLSNKCSDYIGLLSYIKFLNNKKEDYYLLCYHMNKLGIEMENIIVYLNSLLGKLKNLAIPYVLKKEIPRVNDVLREIGLSEETEENKLLIKNIIDFSIMKEGYKVNSSNKLEFCGRIDNRNIQNASESILCDFNYYKKNKVLKQCISKNDY